MRKESKKPMEHQDFNLQKCALKGQFILEQQELQRQPRNCNNMKSRPASV